MDTVLKNTPLHILSIDFEEWFQVNSFAAVYKQSDWLHFDRRLNNQTELLLRLLAKHKAKATFFVVGWVAEHYQPLLAQIAGQGHEIASHGHLHKPLPDLGPVGFRQDLMQSKQTIEAITGRKVVGFRAPNWSLSSDASWAPDILVQCGFTYDSSVFPINLRYGQKDAPRFPYRHACGLAEFPLSTLRVPGKNIPVGGGVFFRLEPLMVTRYAIRQYNWAGMPFVLYLHPWELDPLHPRVKLNLMKKISHYAGLHTTQPKLEALLARHCFTSFENYIGTYGLPVSRVKAESV